MNSEIEKHIQIYNIYIYDKVKNILDSGKKYEDFDYKSDLHKIFEYFTCIKLTQETGTIFQEYGHIDRDFKEENSMSRMDTGIDACNSIDTIVQCKLRQHTLTWKECTSFFASNYNRDNDNKLQLVWNNLVIARNSESKLAKHLQDKSKLFTDKTYSRTEIIDYCKHLIKNPPLFKS